MWISPIAVEIVDQVKYGQLNNNAGGMKQQRVI